MGLGLFIAKTLLEHLGGIVSFKNRDWYARTQTEWKGKVSDTEVSSKGAIVTVQFDRADLEEKLS